MYKGVRRSAWVDGGQLLQLPAELLDFSLEMVDEALLWVLVLPNL